MKKLLWLAMLFISVAAFGQTTGKFRYDTVVFEKIGGNAEFYLRNATRNVNGIMVNVGGGRVEFRSSSMLNDSTLIVGLDTLTIPGGGGGGGLSGLTATRLLIGLTSTTVTNDPLLTYNVSTDVLSAPRLHTGQTSTTLAPINFAGYGPVPTSPTAGMFALRDSDSAMVIRLGPNWIWYPPSRGLVVRNNLTLTEGTGAYPPVDTLDGEAGGATIAEPDDYVVAGTGTSVDGEEWLLASGINKRLSVLGMTGATTAQLRPFMLNYRAQDTTASGGYWPIYWNAGGSGLGNWGILHQSIHLAGQTGYNETMWLGYNMERLNAVDSGASIHLGLEANWRQPGHLDNDRWFEFNFEIRTRTGFIYRPSSWTGGKHTPYGNWLFRADSYDFGDVDSAITIFSASRVQLSNAWQIQGGSGNNTSGFKFQGNGTDGTVFLDGLPAGISLQYRDWNTIVFGPGFQWNLNGGTNESLNLPRIEDEIRIVRATSFPVTFSMGDYGTPYFTMLTDGGTGEHSFNVPITWWQAFKVNSVEKGRFTTLGFYLPASTTANAPLNIAHGVAPDAPVNGDFWTTTTSAYAHINGVTVDLVGGGGGGTIDGSGTTDFISRWDDANTLEASDIRNPTGQVGINETPGAGFALTSTGGHFNLGIYESATLFGRFRSDVLTGNTLSLIREVVPGEGILQIKEVWNDGSADRRIVTIDMNIGEVTDVLNSGYEYRLFSGSTEMITGAATGVGIFKNNPTRELDLAGSFRFTKSGAAFNGEFHDYDSVLFRHVSNSTVLSLLGKIDFISSGNNSLQWIVAGATRISENLDAGTGGHRFKAHAGGYFFEWETAGALAMTMNTAQEVLIGTTDAGAYKFQLVGNAKVDNLRITATSPTAGDVWTATDTDGNGEWAAPAGDANTLANGKTGLTATTVGGILLGTSTSAFTNLTIGANNTVLTSNGTTASWQAPASAPTTLYSGDGTLAGNRQVSGSGVSLAIGTTGARLTTISLNSNNTIINSNLGIAFIGPTIQMNGFPQIPAQSSSDANYSATSANGFIILAEITAGRTFDLSAVPVGSGCKVIIWNKNSSGNAWTLTGSVTLRDAAGSAITVLTNDTIYEFISDGTDLIRK